MARDIATIKQEIVDAKNAETALSGLTSTSQTAIWNLWAYIVAFAIYTMEVLWDSFKSDLDLIAAAAIPGTIRWYYNQALAWQYGYALVWDGSRFSYTTIDAAACIIKRVAIREVGGQVRIKVAKEATGLPVKLDSAELTAFQAYMAKVKFAGTNLSIVSYDSDLLKIAATIYYDPLLLAADGSLLTNSAIFPIEDAINDYIASIEFGGIFNKTKLVDAIQRVVGCEDVITGTIEGKAYAAASYSTVSHTYDAVAGYMTVNTFTLTYTPYV